MPFVKGQSGNPGGRPKRGVSMTDILRELGDIADVNLNGTPVERKRALAEAVWSKAIKERDMTAIKFIYERTDGLPLQRAEVSGGEKPIGVVSQASPFAALSNEELAALEAITRKALAQEGANDTAD